jgi:hypothetical protein
VGGRDGRLGWGGGIGDRALAIVMIVAQTHYFLLASTSSSSRSLARSVSVASSSPQQKIPVFQKKRRVHRGLHMQQSHSSRNGCRLVAIMASNASSNACVVRPRQGRGQHERGRTTADVESASMTSMMSKHQRSTLNASVKHEA